MYVSLHCLPMLGSVINPQQNILRLLAIMYKLICASILSFALSSFAYADYVEVTVDAANVRISPSEASEIVGQAYKGMIFSLEGTAESWLQIALPSGEYRYLHVSLAATVNSVPALTDSEAILRSACEEYLSAEKQANLQAEALEPDFMKRIDLSRVLTDKYKLEIHNKYKIPPARKGELSVWCVTN